MAKTELCAVFFFTLNLHLMKMYLSSSSNAPNYIISLRTVKLLLFYLHVVIKNRCPRRRMSGKTRMVNHKDIDSGRNETLRIFIFSVYLLNVETLSGYPLFQCSEVRLVPNE